jgi:hypothetical protein
MSKKNSKRILSVKLLHETDTSPDTSYLGEYSNNPTSEFSIDRAHSLDCQINSHANDEVVEKLERAVEHLNDNKRGLSQSMYDDISDIDHLMLDAWDQAQDILIEKQEELAECDCDERGDMGRGEYRYFNSSFNYVDKNGKPTDGLTPEEVRSYVKQDYERMESLNAGHWSYMGIRAEAEIILDPFGIATVQRISSGGLWGIESDSDASYITDVENDELSDLRHELHAIGFSKRAISTAFKNVERAD